MLPGSPIALKRAMFGTRLNERSSYSSRGQKRLSFANSIRACLMCQRGGKTAAAARTTPALDMMSAWDGRRIACPQEASARRGRARVLAPATGA